MKPLLIEELSYLRHKVGCIPAKFYNKGAGYSIELRIRRIELILANRYKVSI